MLVIKYTDLDSTNPCLIWHVRDPVPKLERVQTLQADGHELRMIERAMQKAYVGDGGDVWFQHEEG